MNNLSTDTILVSLVAGSKINKTGCALDRLRSYLEPDFIARPLHYTAAEFGISQAASYGIMDGWDTVTGLTPPAGFQYGCLLFLNAFVSMYVDPMYLPTKNSQEYQYGYDLGAKMAKACGF